MSLTNYPPQNRVPGQIYKPKEHALDKDLTKLSMRELLDLKHRQEKLLENKSRLSKLPDKGKKIQDLYDRAIKALELKNEIDIAANLLSSLNLSTKDINNIEWNQKATDKNDVLDSDDDDNPLAILTSSNTVNSNKRIVRNEEQNEPQLITAQDLKEAQEIVDGTLKFDPVLLNVCKNENFEACHRFLPHKPRSNSSSLSSVIESLRENKVCDNSAASTLPHSDQEVLPHKPRANLSSSSSSLDSLKENKIRDNSAATPPVYYQGVKLLPLRESIEAEHKHRKRMKELQDIQAAERLAIKIKELGSDFMQSSSRSTNTILPEAGNMSKYRLAPTIFDDDAEDDEAASMSEEEDDE